MRLRFNCGLPMLIVLTAVALRGGCGSSDPDGGTTAAARAAEASAPGPDDWPFFGRVPQRTHYLPEPDKPLDPPFKQIWSLNTHALIEFPPAIANGVAYVVNKYGNPAAIRLSDRKVIWERKTKENLHGAPLTVTGPAYHDGHVYYASLGGYLVSVDADDGHVDWIRDTHSHLESSPLVVGETLYIGTDTAKLLAVDTADGRTRWTFSAPGAIKASPSYNRGRIFVADYQSSVYAVDAKTGKPRWRYDVGGPVPGSATVIGHTVFTSSFKTRKTVGIDVRDHRRVFFLRQAGYTPMISDGRNLYLVGYYTVTALQPTGN